MNPDSEIEMGARASFGSTRLRRVIFGVAPKISSYKLFNLAKILIGATKFRRDA